MTVMTVSGPGPYRSMTRFEDPSPADRCRETAHEAILFKLKERVDSYLAYIEQRAREGSYEAKVGFGWGGDYNLNREMAHDTAEALQQMGFTVEINFAYDAHPAWRRWFEVPTDDYHWWLKISW